MKTFMNRNAKQNMASQGNFASFRMDTVVCSAALTLAELFFALSIILPIIIRRISG